MMRTPAWWKKRGALSTLLLPFSVLYHAGFLLDRRFTRARRAPLPLIGVGNLTAGGAGKTPTCIALVQLLQSMGEVPHVLSRGYGGAALRVHRVSPHDRADQVGDEPLLLAQHAPTWVGADRLASAHAAHHAGATILVMDDALQHHALRCDLHCIVIDRSYGWGNQRLLPAGPMRQTWRSVDRRILTCVIAIGDGPALPISIAPDVARFDAHLAPCGGTAWLRDNPWLAFAGIAHPEKFYATLRAQGAMLVQTVDFPDHHPYSATQIQQLKKQAQHNGARLITTDKDAMRIDPAARPAVATLPVALRFSDTDALQHFIGSQLSASRRS